MNTFITFEFNLLKAKLQLQGERSPKSSDYENIPWDYVTLSSKPFLQMNPNQTLYTGVVKKRLVVFRPRQCKVHCCCWCKLNCRNKHSVSSFHRVALFRLPYLSCPIQAALFMLPYLGCPIQVALFRLPYLGCPIQVALFRRPYLTGPIQVTLFRLPYLGCLGYLGYWVCGQALPLGISPGWYYYRNYWYMERIHLHEATTVITCV